MKIDLSSTIYLIAAAQALLLTGVIVRKGKMPFSEKYLTAILLTLTVVLISYVSMMNNLFSGGSYFIALSAVSWHALAPLIYLYCRSLTGKDRKWSWNNLFLFVFSAVFIGQTGLALSGINFGLWLFFEDMNTYSIFWLMTYLVNTLIFSLLSVHELKSAQLSEKHAARLRWLQAWLQGFSVALCALIGLLIYWWSAKYFYDNFEFLLVLFFTVFIFSLVAFSLRFSHYFSMMANENYRHTRRDEKLLAEHYAKVDTYLKDRKPYLRPDFKLKDLAQGTGISENDLSQVFNQYCKSGFYQIINRHRLREFDVQLQEKGTKNYTLMALAELSGFASKATFYKAFKEEHGVTPGVYVRRREN